MKRHAALQDLSRDHFHVLFRCQRLRRALEKTGNWEELRGIVEEFLGFFGTDMSPHFREEDDIVVPAAARTETLRDVAERTLTEHRELRRLIDELGAARGSETKTRGLLSTLEPMITTHVKMEEEELFEGLQAALAESDLADIGRRSAAFRREHRRPEASGPRRGRG